MNSLSIKLKSNQNSSCISEYITVEIDGADFLESSEDLKDSIVYSNGLKSSVLKDGKYLIFTCECGIADCGGWNYVDVTHSEKTISWAFTYDQKYLFTFERDSYINEVNRFINDLKKNHKDYLEQETAIEPEN